MGRRPKPFTMYQASNGVWYYSINYTSGVPERLCETRKSTGKDDEIEAMKFVLARIDELKTTQIAAATMTLGEYATRFYGPECPHRKRIGWDRMGDRHAENMRSLLQNHLLSDPVVKRNLRDLSVEDLADYRHRLMKKSLASTTAKKVMDGVRVVMKEALYNRLIPYDPAMALPRLPKRTGPTRAVFTPEELGALFGKFPGVWGSAQAYMAFRLAAFCGLRSAEVRALQWSDLDGQRLQIRRAFKKPDTVTIGLPKWGKTRSIMLPAFIHAELREHLTEGTHWIISKINDQPYSTGWWKQRFDEALVKAGLPKKVDSLPRVPHSFRHTLQTWMIGQGVSPAIVGSYLGHETGLSQVQAGYTHEVDQTEAVRAINNLAETSSAERQPS